MLVGFTINLTMTNLTNLLKKKQEIIDELKNVEKEIKTEQSKTVVKCSFCNVEYMVCNLIYIRTHWYTPPSGCIAGDYWNEGDGEFKCLSCNRINRLPSIIKELQYRFKRIEDTYVK